MGKFMVHMGEPMTFLGYDKIYFLHKKSKSKSVSMGTFWLLKEL